MSRMDTPTPQIPFISRKRMVLPFLSISSGCIHELRKPWNKCPNCHQYYQSELAVDLANKFVSYVKDQYPHNLVKQADTFDVKQMAS